MNPYEQAYHRMQKTFADLLQRDDLPVDAQWQIFECDQQVEEIFLSHDESSTQPEEE